MPQHRHSLFSLLLIAASAGTALGQVDSVTMVLDPAAGIGSKSLATFGYNPVNDSIYVTTYGAGSDAPGNGAVVRFDNIASGSPTFTTLMSEAQLQLYYRDGDPDRSVSTPSQSGFLLNPLPVGDRPAYSFAMITDLALTRLPGSNTVDPTATKRVYSYSLEPVAPTGDGRDVFTTRVTLADMKAIAGASSTSSNTGRQFAWSGDGQSIYFVDSSTAYDGLWTVGAVAGSLQRLVADNMDTAEPAVMTAGGIDTIYFGGGGVTGNDGGIDMVTYDGTTVSGRQVAVPAALLREFHETTADANIAAIATDAAGNLYYTNTTNASSSAGTPVQRGIFRYDTEGRISKVVGYAERKAVFGDRGNVNANSLRLQPRTVTYSGSEGDFEVLQLLYAEPSGVNAIGGGSEALSMAKRLERFGRHAYQLAGYLIPGGEHTLMVPPDKVLGSVDDLQDNVNELDISLVIIATRHLDRRDAFQLARRCDQMGLRVLQMPFTWGFASPKLGFASLGGLQLIDLQQLSYPTFAENVKRAFDLLAVISGGAVLMPFLLVVAAMVKLDSPGPVFFTSPRVGKGGRNFPFFKFRSMVANANALKDDLREQNESDGRLFKMKRDPRITRFGRFIRKFSIDELPQLWNVLRGDMNLVGPRPLPEEDLRDMERDPEALYWFELRSKVKPGITGLWQVSGRSSLTFADMVSLDIQYVQSWSLWLDLQILLKTIPAVLRGSGAH